MRIAIVGAGISGLGAALALKDIHDVTLIEGAPRLGGHANTMTIDYDGAAIDVDTGFIVYNLENYPNLTALFAHLGVESTESDMSFALSDADGFEWSSNGLPGIFAWKRNLARPAFLGMLADIMRFSQRARADLAAGTVGAGSLGGYVGALNLGERFRRGYLLPMGAAIWSMPEAEMLDYPAETFLRFFNNHRLLMQRNRPKWRTVTGGSRVYVEKAAAQLEGRIRVGDAVVGLSREDSGATLRYASGRTETYDHVLLACHSDEALAILGPAASLQERTLLSAIRYAPNKAYLHRDLALMPKRKAAWASWNYLRVDDKPSGEVCVSYWMNLLQNIDRARPLFVTLNPPRPPSPGLCFAEIDYAHPQFNQAAIAAQKAMPSIQGVNRVSFAGAWMGYGFHEDGLSAGLAAAAQLGGRPPWSAVLPQSVLEAA